MFPCNKGLLGNKKADSLAKRGLLSKDVSVSLVGKKVNVRRDVILLKEAMRRFRKYKYIKEPDT